jgi:hypothetical protein
MSVYPPSPFHFARTESDVVAILRESLRDWAPDELARLPEKCRPGKIRDGEDIADLAFTLTKTRIDSSEANDFLVRLETLFARACQRLGEIESDRPRHEKASDSREHQ